MRIVSKWPEPHRENPSGKMDMYLGTIMTVRALHPCSAAIMEEDDGGWAWFPEMLETIVDIEDESQAEDRIRELLNA